ncbi:Serine/threonine protein kinase PrkC, regulator of stationary phase [Enhygromyxa salina]|uniref:Serine/threonine protein kinase PrkC, regulator of stationary phase n=1 Tax=Enhygromyxa salina TaxID=215803 RepID=A0A0C2CZJ1_9BACT|nr:PASTA domain-containing protein [Enhygromyxa salina]KIG15050.1 Serine/threonine protein kinase PrkC, regulator of stationary phase [Enhygromyxa salina]
MQDYLKMFLIALVTSVAVLFSLGPFMMKMQAVEGPRPQAEGPTQPAAVDPQPQQPAAPAQLTAPNLQGLDLREARDRWREGGIVIIEDSQRIDATVEAGTILSQSPAGGAPLQTKEIRVVVAAAPELVTVPSVIGKSATTATEALVKAGFEVPAPETEASSEAAGVVLRQEPNAGSKSEKGSLVHLVVAGDGGAEGSPASEGLIEVPKLRNQAIGSARKKLESAGLSVGSVREREDPELGGGRVLSQSPDAGSKVAPGTAVDLVIVAPN